MKTNVPIENRLRKEAAGVATEEDQNAPASIEPLKQASRAGHGTSRLWLPGLGGIVIILAGALLGCSRDSNAKDDTAVPARPVASAIASTVVQVSIKNLQFDPMTIEVKNGEVVEWRNDDMVPHTATATSFDSGTIASGQSWRYTFTNSGNFPYRCTFHPQMKGVVIVK